MKQAIRYSWKMYNIHIHHGASTRGGAVVARSLSWPAARSAPETDGLAQIPQPATGNCDSAREDLQILVY